MPKTHSFSSKVIVYPGAAAWRFLALPKTASQKIHAERGSKSKGWGSLPVTVTIGATTWDTSIFYDSKSGQYLLPLKAAVRKKEGIYDDDMVRFSFRFR